MKLKVALLVTVMVASVSPMFAAVEDKLEAMHQDILENRAVIERAEQRQYDIHGRMNQRLQVRLVLLQRWSP